MGGDFARHVDSISCARGGALLTSRFWSSERDDTATTSPRQLPPAHPTAAKWPVLAAQLGVTRPVGAHRRHSDQPAERAERAVWLNTTIFMAPILQNRKTYVEFCHVSTGIFGELPQLAAVELVVRVCKSGGAERCWSKSESSRASRSQ